jgi:hypothetical protein
LSFFISSFLNNPPAAKTTHPDQKTVGFLALSFFGLISYAHLNNKIANKTSNFNRIIFGAETAGGLLLNIRDKLAN